MGIIEQPELRFKRAGWCVDTEKHVETSKSDLDACIWGR